MVKYLLSIYLIDIDILLIKIVYFFFQNKFMVCIYYIQLSKPDIPILLIPNNQNYKFSFLSFSSLQLPMSDIPQLGRIRIGDIST